jgi:hypothetical protein
MRNVFDQYEQPENRLTHALLSSLDADRHLLAAFVRWVIGEAQPRRHLVVHEQSFPDGDEVDADIDEGRGLPDGCISDGSGWALLIECKLANRWNPAQLRRHLATAARRGLPDCTILCLTVGHSPQTVPRQCVARQWTEVYAWLRQQAGSEWARRCEHYFEIAEARLAASNGLAGGTLTMFTGIPFNQAEPYSYPQAKRILGLMRERLLHHPALRRALHVDPDNPGRGAITGTRARSVWDYIALMGLREVRYFTQYPHLTLGIHDDSLLAMLTMPNSVSPRRRRAMLGASFEQFKERIDAVVRGIAAVSDMAKGMRPVIVVVQRHYASQSAPPYYDATLRFDPRTAVTVKRGRDKGIKTLPQWLRLAYDVFDDRRSNMQFQIGAEFPYERCSAVKSAGITEAVAAVWMASKPMLAEL